MKPRPRSDAYSPRSANGTLYKPEKLAEKLKIPKATLMPALEETGFSKAVRIREELIRWKTRLLDEQKSLHHEIEGLEKRLKQLKQRKAVVQETLIEIRNILRIPREDL